jgi:hypothetical protein
VAFDVEPQVADRNRLTTGFRVLLHSTDNLYAPTRRFGTGEG